MLYWGFWGFFVAFFIWCVLSGQFRWTVHFWLLLRYSLTFISQEKNDQRRYKFLTENISKFLFLAVEDIRVLYPTPPPLPTPYKTKTNHAIFLGKILFKSHHHGSNINFINKTTILLQKSFQINSCMLLVVW